MEISPVEWLVKEILYKHPNNDIHYFFGHSKSLLDAVNKAKEIEKEQKDTKINLAISEFERLKDNCESLRDIVYLDGVLAVLDSIKDETFKKE
jgi:hypothetical protein